MAWSACAGTAATVIRPRRDHGELDFQYSNRVARGVDDVPRTMRAIKGAKQAIKRP
jgi:hypothetical protein